MNDSLHLAHAGLQSYATASYACSYLPGKRARSQVMAPSELIDDAAYAQLIANGFRRSGTFVYRPHCDACQACQSIRIPVADFVPSRSQRRAWRQHAQLCARIIDPVFSAEHYALYSRYQRARHAGGGMDVDDVAQYQDFLIESQVTSLMVEFRQPEAGLTPGPLKMVSVIDQLDDALSAVYTFYAPDAHQCLGTYNVLWQIELARSLGLTYVYLGYWIDGCQKMSYKSRFTPHELLTQGRWYVNDPN
ncbi:MAG: arginyltransferase [Comamonadaceae bacterium CG1_02_60_18]|nr:MAG: arginyltransferase [Comamonadaceae bacterium CG1_02_60_18]PIQ50998.1 MAG: arginyltransferase [Comamonadaceae bacterium CG12_big_fil_rev_8_21_14_0_65_59_15]